MKRISLTAWIFIGMAVATPNLAPDFAKQLGPVSTVFLRLIRSIIARCCSAPG
jgi:proton glutamate symport protein